MYCPVCRTKMVEEKRIFHKQRKWICPKCGQSRMQVSKLKKKTKRQELI